MKKYRHAWKLVGVFVALMVLSGALFALVQPAELLAFQ